ncbi:MAG: hypothetical protein WDO68_09945 [Gammaproteobacteria bacterium]
MSNDVPVVRSVVSVAAGFFAVMVLGAAADVVLAQVSPNAFDAQGHARAESTLFIKLTYETLFALLAGYLTARIAVRKPFMHVLVMAAIVLAGRAFIAVATWDVVPLWFNLGVLVLVVPAALLGAKLNELRNRATA